MTQSQQTTVRWLHGAPVAEPPSDHSCCRRCNPDVHFYPLDHCDHDADPFGCGRCDECDESQASEQQLPQLRAAAAALMYDTGLNPDGSIAVQPIRNIESAVVTAGLAASVLSNPDIAVEITRALANCRISPAGVLPPAAETAREHIAGLAERAADRIERSRVDPKKAGDVAEILKQWLKRKKPRLARILRTEARRLRIQPPAEAAA